MAIHVIALGLHAIGSSNSLTFFFSPFLKQWFGEEVWLHRLKRSITQFFYLRASSLSPNSTLKTTILPLIPDLNSSFGHTACS